MNKTILKLVFDEIQIKYALDFAIINSEAYGTNEQAIRLALADKFGENARGIWGHKSPEDIANGKDDVLYISTFNLTRDNLKDITTAFCQMGYYVIPCTGNYNLSGFFSIEEIPAEKRCRIFFVETPIGMMKVYAKHDVDTNEYYPGAWLDLVSEDGDETTLACVEYCPDTQDIAVDAYKDDSGTCIERTHVEDLPGAALAIAKQFILNYDGGETDPGELFADLSRVPLAWTSCECDKAERLHVQVYADLLSPAIVTYIQTSEGEDSVLVSRNAYDTLAELNNDELDILDFDSLVMITEEEWEVFRRSEDGLRWLRDSFPAGTRIRLTEDMADPLHPIPKGTAGTVDHIDDMGTIHMEWDTGSSLGLIFAKDEFEVICEEVASNE